MFIRWIFHGNAHLGVVCYHSLSQWVCWSSLQVIMMCSCFFSAYQFSLVSNCYCTLSIPVAVWWSWCYVRWDAERDEENVCLSHGEREKVIQPYQLLQGLLFNLCFRFISFHFLPGFYLYLARIEIKSSHFIWSHHGDKTRLAKTEGKELLP